MLPTCTGWYDHRCRRLDEIALRVVTVHPCCSLCETQVVHAHCPKGLAASQEFLYASITTDGTDAFQDKFEVMTLDGPEKPKGMLDMVDISRKARA